jgi:hypothetical protein
MKKMATILGFFAVFVLTFCSLAFADPPPLGGSWTGWVLGATYTNCQSESVSINLYHCKSTGNLVRGTAKIGNSSIAIVGRFKVVDNIGYIYLNGEEDTATSFTNFALVGQYISSTPATIQVSEMDFVTVTSMGTSSKIFDSFTLTKH